ncbi:hypothetical protein [Candidatus Soleaferrea massiliensis]|uniref:hypothetical protein n=1 Tax=Candidatus Soleaferrea massiliensis TaxID=1470354 RepID=UPI00058EC392|nr:hypothetical protein [Candidatus Soleaferrea massiliensis]
MKRWRIPVLCLAAVLAFLFPAGSLAAAEQAGNESIQKSTPANAVGSRDKDESIYVNLMNDGSVDGVYVVNSFELPAAGSWTDYGNYTRVTNLSTTDPISCSGGTVTGSAPAGRFYYQGDLENAALPWDIALTYKLDGREMPAEELAGKSGQLSIELRIQQNKAGQALFFEHYCVQASMTLDAAKCRNITTESATVAAVGSQKTLSFMVLPGKEASFTIEADVRDFTMDGLQLTALPLNLAVDLGDAADFTGDIQTLQNGVAELDDGAQALYSGLCALSDGALDLDGGAGQFGSGLKSLQSNAGTLQSASAQVLGALEALSDALPAEYGDSDDQLTGGLDALSGGIRTLSGSLQAVSENMKRCVSQLGSIANMLPDEEDEAVASAADALSGSEDPNVQILLQAYRKQSDGIRNVKAALLEDQKALELLCASLDGIADSAGTLAGTVAGMGGQLSGQISQTLDGMKALSGGLRTLSAQYRGFHDGLCGYTSGVSDLADAYDGVQGGVHSLSGGLGEARDGMRQLTGGTGQLREGTATMDDDMREQLEQAMDAFLQSDFEPVSFVSAGNQAVGTVQFICKTPGIAAEEPPASPPPEERELSFWDRVAALFS